MSGKRVILPNCLYFLPCCNNKRCNCIPHWRFPYNDCTYRRRIAIIVMSALNSECNSFDESLLFWYKFRLRKICLTSAKIKCYIVSVLQTLNKESVLHALRVNVCSNQPHLCVMCKYILHLFP